MNPHFPNKYELSHVIQGHSHYHRLFCQIGVPCPFLLRVWCTSLLGVLELLRGIGSPANRDKRRVNGL